SARNSGGVSAVAEVAPDFVAKQLDAVLTEIPADATKTGMLLTAGVIDVVAQKVKQHAIRNLIVDPVMISTSGAPLIKPDAITVFRRALLPLAFLMTPNVDEAKVLTGETVRTAVDMERAARQIHSMGARNVLIKGGHLEDAEAADILFDGREFSYFRSQRIATLHTHGTGCVLSASIAAYVALGKSLKEAVGLGKEFVTK